MLLWTQLRVRMRGGVKSGTMQNKAWDRIGCVRKGLPCGKNHHWMQTWERSKHGIPSPPDPSIFTHDCPCCPSHPTQQGNLGAKLSTHPQAHPASVFPPARPSGRGPQAPGRGADLRLRAGGGGSRFATSQCSTTSFPEP